MHSDPEFSTVHERGSLRIERKTTPPGLIKFDVDGHHRIRMHAGVPVSGTCKAHSFVLTRGDIDLYPAGAADSWQEDGSSTFLLVSFRPDVLYRSARDLGIDPVRATLEQRYQIRDAQIEHILWALDAECRADYPSGRMYTESLGLALAIRLLAPTPSTDQFRGGLTQSQLRRLLSHIEEHIASELTLTELADLLGISVSHLKTSFRRTMKMPVHQYVLQRRVHHAKELLLRGHLPPSQVALEAGFSHQSHMARWTKRLLGVPPSELSRRPKC